MSFRELRNFTEIMKALGYPRLISVENFRTPNFELVADVLFWLLLRYEPTAEVSDDIATEDARVEFLKAIANILVQKARVKLNIKKLYQADGYAVKELLKVCTLLYKAMRAKMDADAGATSDLALAGKMEDLKQARNLATEIVDSGAKLYTLIGKEEELRAARTRALKFLDSISLNLESNDPHDQIERNIREQINIISDNVVDLNKMCTDLQSDQDSLRQKITRKHQELERAEKRFKSLKKVRPAFMEEYEHLEAELKQVYDTYLERFRNLQYLESELAKYHEAEMEKKQEADRALKRMQKRLREEELRILRGEQEVDENGIDDSVFDSGKEDMSSEEGMSRDKRRGSVERPTAPDRGGRPRRNDTGHRSGGKRAAVVGSMTGGSTDDDSDESELSNFNSGDSDETETSDDDLDDEEDEDEEEEYF